MNHSKIDKHKHDILIEIEEIFVFLVILFIIFRFIIGFSFVDGLSMYPTFNNGDFVMYTRITNHYEVGDVVSVKMPTGVYYVKRIVAKGKDTVDIHDGALYINGVKEENGYGVTETQDEGIMEYPYTLKENEYFVLGDNREVSLDSRTFGAVGPHQIKGKIWSIFYE